MKRKKFKGIRLSPAVFMKLSYEKMRRETEEHKPTWDELIESLLREYGFLLSDYKYFRGRRAYFTIKVSEELYNKLKSIKDKYNMTWDELFVCLLPSNIPPRRAGSRRI